MTKKLLVETAVSNGDYLKAMKIAKGFTRDLTPDERSIVTRAYEMQTRHGSFYEQLGFNKEDQYEKAVSILNSVFNNGGEQEE